MRADFPVLARLEQTARATWREICAALAARAAADLGEDIARVAVLGDPAALPPSALGLTLASGRRVVYRPRDLRAGAWFLELCREVNERGLSAPLHVRALDARVGYAWDDWIEPAPCPGADAARRYFVRAGALARLLQLARATDMHRDNVIAAGEHPVLVDFDGLLRPARRGRSCLDATPYATGFLPAWVAGEPGRAAIAAGGLGPATAPASPHAHRDAVLEGYDEVDALLGRIDVAAWLGRAAALPVRRFPRPVAAQRRLLARSLAPDLARSEETRDAWLAAAVTGPDAAAERAALRDGRVPLLFAPAGAAAAPPRDPALDRDVIAAALALGEPPAPPAPLAGAPRDLDWVAAARAIADEVMAAGLDAGQVWAPWAGVRALAPLPADVPSGWAGAALVLAELHAATGAPGYAAAARRALVPVARAVASPARWSGAYLGLGGQLHALQVCGELLAEPAALALAGRRAAALAGEEPGGADDLVSGLAGLAVACPEAWLGDRLLARRRAGLRPAPFPPGDGLPPGLPGLDDGVAWALRRIAARTGDTAYAVAAPAWTPGADARARARAVAGHHAATGSWLPGARVPDRLDPAGLLAVAHLFLVVGAGAPPLVSVSRPAGH